MSSVKLPGSVLPTPTAEGGFKPPERVFAVTTLNSQELNHLARFAGVLIDNVPVDPNTKTWGITTDDMVRTFPWLKAWNQTAEDFLTEYGSSLTPAVRPDDGFMLKMFLNRHSEDHMDLPRLRPAALSIGLVGRRELVGIVQPSPEATVELSAKLLKAGTPLRDLKEVEGVPVERYTQNPGDVVTIGNFCTLHSGYPLERSAALAIASRNEQEGGDPQYIIDHYNQFFPEAM
jgi:hypothetical protein